MPFRHLLTRLQFLNDRIRSIEAVMSDRQNMLIFLIVRFLLMSGMVVGFTWASLQLAP
jgi:predicted Na+-dependent transporter